MPINLINGRDGLEQEKNMFNSGAKNEALEKLECAESLNSSAAKRVAKASESLTTRRYETAELIGLIESYVNGLVNTPKEFRRQVKNSRSAASAYKKRYTALKIEAEKAFQRSSATVGAGAGLGFGVAALGPSPAMGVAATFGTASTGTAITTLSGAAATNASLAWLGGGALAAGGGGMTAGSAFLALAGPIGWGIGAVAVVGSGTMYHYKNAEIVEKADAHRLKVAASTRKLNMAFRGITQLEGQTREQFKGAVGDLNWLIDNAPGNYLAFSTQQRHRIGALVNHARAMGENIGKEFSL